MDLPVSKSKKRKIIQIMYPAPYSQSWEPDALNLQMMKNREKINLGGPRGPKTKRAGDSPRAWSQQFPERPDPTLPHLKYGVFRIRRGPTPRQIMYPTPYSQSWDRDALTLHTKKNREKNLGGPRVPKTRRAEDSPRAWSQQFPERPDPTLPHLKYGVFRNRRGPTPRHLLVKPEKQPRIERFPKNTPPKSIPPAKLTMVNKSLKPVIRVPREPSFSYSSSSSAENQSEMQENRIKEKSRYPPLIVSRTINESYKRKLSLSNTMHVDIKPRKIGTSDSTCTQPQSHYWLSSRKTSRSPVRKRNNNMRNPIKAIL